MLQRTDIGTFLLHWLLVAALVITVLTGFRLTWDGIGATFSRRFDAVLLNGDVWTLHFYAALTLFAVSVGYFLYIRRAALFSRNALGRLRLLKVQAPTRLKWQAVNIALHWVFYGLALALMLSGTLLYLGFGGVFVTIHMVLAVASVVYALVHILGHFLQGGLGQILRIFLPQRLVPGAGVRAFALPVALASGVVTAFAIAATDLSTQPTLAMAQAGTPPKLDGTLDDEGWRGIPMVRVRTQQGANLAGGKGESDVEVRALRHGEDIYFAFRWQDPSRSLKRLPLVKTAEGWRLMNDAASTADETAFYEDKFAVLFSKQDHFGGGVTHMGEKPLAGLPGAINRRGLHATTDGSILDMWQWKASRGGMLGFADDMHIGPPYPADAAQKAGTGRYSAGYLQDPGTAFYRYNYKGEPPGGYKGNVTLLRLPRDYAATKAKLGKVDITPGVSDDDGSQWWMFDEETAPYSAELDARIPVGAVIPSTLIGGTYSGDRAEVAAAARWKDGWWTLELKRRAKTGSKFDLDFIPGQTLYIWVSVFDHTQTRHTRHVRPIRLVIPG
jgi:cytochrome b subunit of formate dehydrogenase